MEKMIKRYRVLRYLFHPDGTCTIFDSGYMDSKIIEAKDVNDVVMWLNKNGIGIIGISKGNYLICNEEANS